MGGCEVTSRLLPRSPRLPTELSKQSNMLHTTRESRLTCVAMLAPLSLDHAITAAATSFALSAQFSLSIRSPGSPCRSRYLARTLPTNANDPYALRDDAIVSREGSLN